jgi:NAD(P)H-hydrate epimerase
MHEVVDLMTMKKIESYTLKQKQMDEVRLIDDVAKALFKSIKQTIKKDDLGVCFAGLGNNGADASKLADYLIDDGYNLKLIVVGNQTALSPSHASILSTLECPYNWCIDDYIPKEIETLIVSSDYIIDGLFGTGLNKPLKGIYASLVHLINASNKTVYSIDMPSGLNGVNGLVESVAVKATKTLAIEYHKFGYYLNDGLDYTGTIETVKVGMMPNSKHKIHTLIDKKLSRDTLTRTHNTHKYNYGNTAIFGGSSGMMGAMHLSALSAYKMGAGLVHTYTLKKYLPYYTQHTLEVLNHFYDRTMVDDLKKIDAFAFGMGLGKKDHHKKRLKDLLGLNKPIVIDADGINYFDPSWAHHLTIITPHIGEFVRLTKTKKSDFIMSPIEVIKNFMKTFKGILVLKGPATIIAKDDDLFIMPHGDASLAKAGSGDVLSGIILALIGVKKDPLVAAQEAVLVHAIAGRLAKEDLTILSVLASDIINYLPQALRLLVKEKV